MNSQSPLKTLAANDPMLARKVAAFIWVGLLAGQVIFVVAVLLAISFGAAPQLADVGRLVFYVSLGILATTVPVGYMMRRKIFEDSRVAGRVSPGAYVSGNIILWAICEGASMVGIVAMLLMGEVLPAIVVPVLAIIVQVVNFPAAAPLEGEAADPVNPYQ